MAEIQWGLLNTPETDWLGKALQGYQYGQARRAQAEQQAFANAQARAQEERLAAQHSQDAALKAAQIGKIAEEDWARRMEMLSRAPEWQNAAMQVGQWEQQFGRSAPPELKRIIGSPLANKSQLIQQYVSQYVKPATDEVSKVEDAYTDTGMVQPTIVLKSGKTLPLGAPVSAAEFAKRKASGSGQTPFFQAVDTPQGVLAFNARTGTLTQPTLPSTGAPVMKSQSDVGLQRQLAGGKEVGKSQGERYVAAPAVITSLEQQAQLLENIDKHPGFRTSVGAGMGQVTRFIPGTSAADFNAQIGQILGGSFLEAFESLRGGGAITQIEGEKATQAKNRMSTSTSEKEFVKARDEYLAIVRKGLERAKQSIQTGQQFIGGQQPAPSATPTQQTERKTIGGKTYEKRNGQWFAL